VIRNFRTQTLLHIVGLFFVGVVVALALWQHIAPDYHGEYGIIGTLSKTGYHPLTNMLRFLLFILLPALLIGMYWFFAKPKNVIYPEPKREKVALSWPVILISTVTCLIMIVVALNAPTYHSWGSFDSFHEGEALGSSEAYGAGLAPYKDYVIYHGVFQDPLRVIVAFNIFGESIGSVRTLESIIKIVTYVLFAGLILLLFRFRFVPTMIAVAVFTTLHFIRTIGPIGYDIIIMNREIPILLFLIASIIFYDYLRNVRAKHALWNVFSLAAIQGVLVWVAFAYSIDRGAYLLALYPFAIAGLVVIAKPKYRKVLLAGNAVGLILGTIIFGILIKGAWFEFVNFIMVDVSKYVEPMFGLPYPVDKKIFLSALIIFAANVLWLLWRFLQAQHPKIHRKFLPFIQDYFIELMLLGLSLFVFRGALGRSDPEHLAYSTWPMILLSLYICIKYYVLPFLERNMYAAKFVKNGSVIFVILALGAGSMRIAERDLWVQNFPLRVPDSLFIPSNYTEATTFFKHEISQGKSFATYTSEAGWYYMTDQTPPTRFGIIWFAAANVHQQTAINELQNNDVDFILYSNDFWANKIDGISNQERLPLLYQYVNDEYQPHVNLQGNQIWIKK